MKRYNVKHYFVLARIIKKDGSLSKTFSSRDFLDKEKAESYLKECNEQGLDYIGRKTLPFQLIEYEALQPKERVYDKQKALKGIWILVEGNEFATIWTPPKSVRELYNKNAGLD